MFCLFVVCFVVCFLCVFVVAFWHFLGILNLFFLWGRQYQSGQGCSWKAVDPELRNGTSVRGAGLVCSPQCRTSLPQATHHRTLVQYGARARSELSPGQEPAWSQWRASQEVGTWCERPYPGARGELAKHWWAGERKVGRRSLHWEGWAGEHGRVLREKCYKSVFWKVKKGS